MQYDNHVIAWQAWRFWKTGRMIQRIELGADGHLKYTWIDPKEVYAS